MSKITKKINNIKNKLDRISGLDGEFVEIRIRYIEKLVNRMVYDIEKHEKENELNCTIFEGKENE